MAEFRRATDIAAAQSAADYGTTPSALSSAERANVTSNDWAEDFAGVDEAVAREQRQSQFGSSGRNSGQNIGGGNPTGGNYSQNPLDNFVNYTYGLTLSAMKAGISPGNVSGGKVIAASGGRRENRAEEFNEDFYFEMAKMTTVIGMTPRSRSSNVIDMQFTIIEPYGISLLNRLLSLAASLGIENWTEMQFVMRVDFYGNNEAGMPAGPLDGQTKYIPMRIISCDIKASVRGSEYKFTAIPYHHVAYQQSTGITPVFVEVTAETVKDFFNGDGETNGSYGKALNDYQEKLVTDKLIKVKDEYEFEIGGDIGKAIIVQKPKNHLRSAPTAHDNNKKAKLADGIAAANSREDQAPAILDQTRQSIPINAGTTIIDVINQTIRNSDYISKQVGKGGGGDGVVKWYKIIPSVKNLEYDSIRKTTAKKFTYRVVPAELVNTKYPDAPMGQPKSASKKYDYMYTGKNQSILDFSIDFNTMFYTAITAGRYKLKKSDVSPEPKDDSKTPEEGGVNNQSKDNDISCNRIEYIAAATEVATPHQGANDVANTSANDLYNSLMSTSRGDMINVKLKITGDPELLKQDDVSYPSEGTYGSIDQYGSLTSDGGELYVDLFFRSPNDLDQTTGMYDFSNWQEASFNGRYRIITVDNLFERGQFTQTLDLVRVFNQAAGSASDAGGGGSAGTSSGADTGGRGSDAPSGAAEMSEAEVANELQRLIARSRNVPGGVSTAPAAFNKETATRADPADVDPAENNARALQNNFNNIPASDISNWNIS